MEVTKVLQTETGHRLTNYSGKCAHLHGHSYRWEVTVEGRAENNGMVIDFKQLKQLMEEVIGPLDHALVLHDNDPMFDIIGEDGFRQLVTATDGNNARLLIVPFNPTVENLVRWKFNQLRALMPEDVNLNEIVCWETVNSYARLRLEDLGQ